MVGFLVWSCHSADHEVGTEVSMCETGVSVAQKPRNAEVW